MVNDAHPRHATSAGGWHPRWTVPWLPEHWRHVPWWRCQFERERRGRQYSCRHDTFGPATVMVGDCQSDTFTILSGQLDINVNTDIVYAIPRNVVTTNTYLTTQVYVISGTGG